MEIGAADSLRLGTDDFVAVARAAGHCDPEALSWDLTPIKHVNIIDTTGGLYEVRGRPGSNGSVIPWSGVLKVLRRSEDGECDAPGSWCYWRREAEFYASELPSLLPRSLGVPRGYGVTDRGDSCGIWMQNVSAGTIETWDMDDYRRAAIAVGGLAGLDDGGRTPPGHSWLVNGFLRSVLADGGLWASFMSPDGDDSVWKVPLVQESFSGDKARAVQDMWAERETLLESLDRLPRVFCHNDFHRRNLLLPADPDRSPVAVDWAFCGPGPLGTDPAQLVGGTLFFCDVSIDQAEELEAAVFDGYLDGIHRAGWSVDPRLIRLGFTASMALWHAVTMPGWVGIMLPDEEEVDVQALFGRSAAAVKDVWVGLQEFAMDRVHEAKSLSNSLGL